MAFFADLLDPHVDRHLLSKEFIVDQVHKHWVTRLAGTGLVLLGIAAFVLMAVQPKLWFVFLIAGLALGVTGFARIHVQNMDRFVVTNTRVFRVNGVLDQKMASVPLARLLDITMKRPLPGMILNFGNFVFETAAQEQGLKNVTFVPDIERRHKILQYVIQRAGVRANAGDHFDADYQRFFKELDQRPKRRLFGRPQPAPTVPQSGQVQVSTRRRRRKKQAIDPNDLDGT